MQPTSTEDSSTLTRALARGAGINVIGFVVRSVLLFTHGLAAVRLFGAEAYGVYSVGVAAVLLASTVGQAGLGRTLIRFVAVHVAKESGQVMNILRIALVISVIASATLGITMSILAEQIARLFHDSTTAMSFRVLGLTVPIATISALVAAFTQGLKHMHRKVVALDIVAPAVELAAIVVLAGWNGQRYGLLVAYVFSRLVSAVLLIHYARVEVAELVEVVPDSAPAPRPSLLRPMMTFAAPVLAMDTLMAMTQRVSTLMLGTLATSTMVSVYQILRQLTTPGVTFLTSINYMLSPMVADLVERRHLDDLSRLYKVSARWALVISLPIFLGIMFYSTQILQVFGPEFAGGARALSYLIGSMVFNVSTGSCGVILMMSGYPFYSAANETLMLVTVVGLNLLLIPTYGLDGAAWSIAVGTVIVNTLRALQVWWHWRIHPLSRGLAKVMVAGMVMAAVLGLWNSLLLRASGSWSLIVIGIAVAALSYGSLLFSMGLESDEKDLLRALQHRLMQAAVFRIGGTE